LGRLGSGAIQDSLANALAEDAVEVRVAAAEALVRMEARDLYGHIRQAIVEVTRDDQPGDVRQRAGGVLSAIPGGVEPLYQPIQAELERGGWERALELIEVTLGILPDNTNMFWWRAHALKALGRLDQAAESFQRAFELEHRASVIPQALAQTFLGLDDPQRAVEAARRGVEIDPGDADAQAILAWSSYKAGAIPEAVEAANKAVDLDPVHGDAVWIVLLGHLRQADAGAARTAFHHAQRVRRLLSPGLDTSFMTTFAGELESIQIADADISRLLEEIDHTLHSEDEARSA
jgi:tetratricopeptide (TPR) repeat protein